MTLNFDKFEEKDNDVVYMRNEYNFNYVEEDDADDDETPLPPPDWLYFSVYNSVPVSENVAPSPPTKRHSSKKEEEDGDAIDMQLRLLISEFQCGLPDPPSFSSHSFLWKLFQKPFKEDQNDSVSIYSSHSSFSSTPNYFDDQEVRKYPLGHDPPSIFPSDSHSLFTTIPAA
jgi:hypothetical protein